MGLASPIVGNCLESFPARVSVALGGIALAAGFLLGAIANSFWQIVALYASVLALGAAFTGMLPAQSVSSAHSAGEGRYAQWRDHAGHFGGRDRHACRSDPAGCGVRLATGILITAAIVLATIVPAAWFSASKLRRARYRGAWECDGFGG